MLATWPRRLIVPTNQIGEIHQDSKSAVYSQCLGKKTITLSGPSRFLHLLRRELDNHVDRHRDVDPEDIWHLVTISKYYLYWYKYCNKCRLLQDKSNFSNKTENKNSDIYKITSHDQNRNKVYSENLHWHLMPWQKSFGRNFSETEEKVLKPNSSSTEVSQKALDLDTSE